MVDSRALCFHCEAQTCIWQNTCSLERSTKHICPHLRLAFCKHFSSPCYQTFCHAGEEKWWSASFLKGRLCLFGSPLRLAWELLSSAASVTWHESGVPQLANWALTSASQSFFQSRPNLYLSCAKARLVLCLSPRPPPPPFITLTNCSCRPPVPFPKAVPLCFCF